MHWEKKIHITSSLKKNPKMFHMKVSNFAYKHQSIPWYVENKTYQNRKIQKEGGKKAKNTFEIIPK